MAEAECRRQKCSEVLPQGGNEYNYKALQRIGGEPPVFAHALGWEPFFSISNNLPIFHMNSYFKFLFKLLTIFSSFFIFIRRTFSVFVKNTANAHVAQLVEHHIGNVEVCSSILHMGFRKHFY